MRSASLWIGLILLSSSLASAAPKVTRKKKKAAPAKAKVEAPVEAKAPEPPPPPPPPPADSDLAVFGAELDEVDGGLTVSGVLDDSHADELPLKVGDGLADLDGTPVKTRLEAAAAWRSLGPRARSSAVVSRALGTEHLQGDTPGSEPAPWRSNPLTLSAQEMIFRDQRLKEASAAAQEVVKKGQTDFVIEAKQTAWVRFPKGISPEAKPGDIIEALTTTPVMADVDLDFISLPAGSRLWAKVVDAMGPAQTRNLRLFFFRLQPLGRGYYAAAARVTEISGDQRLVKTSAGGTIVLPPDAALRAEIRAKVEFLDPIVLTEPATYFRAGPGLWLKSDAKGYALAKVVPGRAGANAGLAEGDPILTINGRFIEKYDFSEAISMLYGGQGELVKVGISRSKGGKLETFELARGMVYKDGKGTPAPRPALIAGGAAAPAQDQPAISEDADQALDSLLKKEAPAKVSPKKN